MMTKLDWYVSRTTITEVVERTNTALWLDTLPFSETGGFYLDNVSIVSRRNINGGAGVSMYRDTVGKMTIRFIRADETYVTLPIRPVNIKIGGTTFTGYNYLTPIEMNVEWSSYYRETLPIPSGTFAKTRIIIEYPTIMGAGGTWDDSIFLVFSKPKV